MSAKGFTILPVKVPAHLGDSSSVTHYMFIKKHSTTVKDATLVDIANRSLFIVNLPLGFNQATVKKFFGDISTGAIVENTQTWEDVEGIDLSRLTSEMKNTTALEFTEKSGPRAQFKLPANTGIVTFLDKSALDLAYQSVKKLAASKKIARFEPVLETGRARYQFSAVPDSRQLELEVALAMEEFTNKEKEDLEELQEMKSKVDADGFTLVVGSHRKTKNGILGKLQHSNELEKIQKKMKKKEKQDFYKFQIRERKKQEMNDLLAKFKEDQERVKVMRSKREFKPY